MKSDLAQNDCNASISHCHAFTFGLESLQCRPEGRRFWGGLAFENFERSIPLFREIKREGVLGSYRMLYQSHFIARNGSFTSIYHACTLTSVLEPAIRRAEGLDSGVGWEFDISKILVLRKIMTTCIVKSHLAGNDCFTSISHGHALTFGLEAVIGRPEGRRFWGGLEIRNFEIFREIQTAV